MKYLFARLHYYYGTSVAQFTLSKAKGTLVLSDHLSSKAPVFLPFANFTKE